MGLVIETDLGHDPDDYFAITWLLAAGIDVKAIIVTPGHDFQVKLASAIAGDKIKVYKTGQPSKVVREFAAFNKTITDRFAPTISDAPLPFVDNGTVLHNRIGPIDDLLILGPAKSTLEAINHNIPIKFVLMQGGFMPYREYEYEPSIRLEKFEGKESVPSFNPNGCVDAVKLLPYHAKRSRFVGKNVCHSVTYNYDRDFRKMNPPKNEYAEKFMHGLNYLRDAKKMHDLVAAVCWLHPSVGWWAPCYRPERVKGQWTSVYDPAVNCDVLYDIDHERFWEHVYNFS